MTLSRIIYRVDTRSQAVLSQCDEWHQWMEGESGLVCPYEKCFAIAKDVFPRPIDTHVEKAPKGSVLAYGHWVDAFRKELIAALAPYLHGAAIGTCWLGCNRERSRPVSTYVTLYGRQEDYVYLRSREKNEVEFICPMCGRVYPVEVPANPVVMRYRLMPNRIHIDQYNSLLIPEELVGVVNAAATPDLELHPIEVLDEPADGLYCFPGDPSPPREI